MKNIIVAIWLMLLMSIVGTLFWYNELIYHLPTPVPNNYKLIRQGQVIKLGTAFKGYAGKPLFLHFFNPVCPCSRFNISSFKALVHQYSNRVNFVVIVMSNQIYTAKTIQDKFDLDIPIVFDATTAKNCGVYSTPQAVLLDTGDVLYYRGNYNSSRYCNDEKTNYAKIAIEGLLQKNTHLVFDGFALTAYGCRLPNCKK